MTSKTAATALLILSLTTAIGCDQQMTPPRDQIPIIKEAVYQLQARVQIQDRAAIDSLLSAEILDNQQSSDSLLSYIYGPTGDFAFEQFGACDIAYTSDNAEATCFIMDGAHRKDRPIRLSFTKTDTLWLLSSFGPGIPDSAMVDTSGRI